MNDMPAAPVQRHVVDENRRLSESLLWQVQRNFYTRHGADAWRNGSLPFEITSNRYIARAYARAVFAFWRDAGCQPGLSLRIMELGAGHGRFAFLFLTEFSKLHRELSPPAAKFQYVVTDVSERNLEFISRHPRLAPFVKAGLLEFALFDLERDPSPRLVNSGQSLAGLAPAPLAVIANYVFDSVAADAFYVRQQQLDEVLVTLEDAAPRLDWEDARLLARLKISYTRRPVHAGYYPDPRWNKVLEEYRQALPEASVLLPTATLSCFEKLRTLAGGHFLMLAADKGVSHQDELLPEEGLPGMAIHGDGCFSLKVNFNAIGRFLHHAGGEMLLAPHHSVSLTVAAFLDRPRSFYPATAQAFTDFIECSGPDDFFTLGGRLEAAEGSLSMAEILAYLRTSMWSAHIVVKLFPAILRELPQATAGQKEDLHHAAQRIWEGYYSIGETIDIAFYLGVLLLELRLHREAMPFFHESVAAYGPQAAATYNLGLCYFGLGELEEALACMNDALKLDENLQLARTLRDRLLATLGRNHGF